MFPQEVDSTGDFDAKTNIESDPVQQSDSSIYRNYPSSTSSKERDVLSVSTVDFKRLRYLSTTAALV